ncbi:hypothetical protein [Paraburkholderia humisilvae]|uniref:HemN C-terminal domain-containing protein n=2 Tax=Paraburkholderia humisilvae TaxID=627669 RepID=A0A6J5EED1_9BURK|nr:hypothetical protein [Paraburkholderia humisilvae]CAB3764849.1 hypothetical protein LMG29542_04976 [Paraburkholderia humisilvae]
MLSPHEFATLMLVKHAEQSIDFDQADLHTLIERKLVEFEGGAFSSEQPRITDRGHALLARFHALR